MRAKRFQWLSGAAARRPILTVAIVLALAIGGGLLALGLRPSAGIDTFVTSAVKPVTCPWTNVAISWRVKLKASWSRCSYFLTRLSMLSAGPANSF